MSEEPRSASQVEILPLAHIWKDESGKRIGALYGYISLIPEFARRDEELSALRARIAELEAERLKLAEAALRWCHATEIVHLSADEFILRGLKAVCGDS